MIYNNNFYFNQATIGSGIRFNLPANKFYIEKFQY